jgi:hypothetical protein
MISVRDEQIGKVSLGGGEFLLRERLAQTQARGGDEDPGLQGSRRSLDSHDTQKILRAPNESQLYSASPRLGFGAQVREASAGIKVLEAFRDPGPLQGFANLLSDGALERVQAQVRIALQADAHHFLSPQGWRSSGNLETCEQNKGESPE